MTDIINTQATAEPESQYREIAHYLHCRLAADLAQLPPAAILDQYGERVVAALDRAKRQGNFSSVEALGREYYQADEELNFVLAALAAA